MILNLHLVTTVLVIATKRALKSPESLLVLISTFCVGDNDNEDKTNVDMKMQYKVSVKT